MEPAEPRRQRVTMVSPFGQQPVELPDDVPLSQLLPDLLDMAGISVGPRQQDTGWQIATADGKILATDDTLAAQGIRRGAVLQLQMVQQPQPTAPRENTAGGNGTAEPIRGTMSARNVLSRHLPASGAPLAPPSDGLTPLQRVDAVLPQPPNPFRRLIAASEAFLRAPAAPPVRDSPAEPITLQAHQPQPGYASPPPGQASSPGRAQPGRHRLHPADLTLAAPLTRMERARVVWREHDYLSRLDARIMGPRLLRCATIAVVSPKGGVGKTTITALLGTLFSMLRRDPAVAVDTNPDFGSLGRILTPDQSWYVDDLARLVTDDYELSLTALDSRLGRAVHGLLVVPAPTDPARMAALDEAAYERLITRLKDFFSLILLDCGTGLRDPASIAAIAAADQVLLLTDAHPATASLVAESAELLHQWRRPITVVVNRMPAHGSRLDLQQLSHHLPAARGLVVIPESTTAAIRLTAGSFHWRDAPANWQSALRRLAVVLVSDWERLGLARAPEATQPPKERFTR